MVTPPVERDATIGSFEITDLDGNLVQAGTLVRDENGKLALGELRYGDILIDLTWLGWFDAECEYLNGRTYLPNGWVVYYNGDNMQYKVHITNYACTIPNCTIRTEQRYYYGGGICGGAAVEEWFNVTLPGPAITTLYDEYLIVMHPGYGATWCIINFPFNFWWIHFDFILYNGICGVWEP
jgi:hypothetical protein